VGVRESLCTLGNGYFATRGAAPEATADGVHYPGTYIAGCYDRLPTELGGRVLEHEDLVNAPNWLPLTFRAVEGDWFRLDTVEILSYRQELDLKRGVLLRDLRIRDGEGRRTHGEVPRVFLDHFETLSPVNPLGIKGVGESGTLPVAAAIASAVEDALAQHRVVVREVPLSPRRIDELLHGAG